MRRPLLELGIAIACLAWISCATKTELSGVWKADTSAVRSMDQMLVIGVAENDIKRRAFEDGFAAALREQGVRALPSYQILPNPDRLTKSAIERAIRGRGIEGVVVTRLVQIDQSQEYVPPKTYVGPNYYGRRLYGYYGRGYEITHQPGYTINTTIVRLETHLYDANTAELVWAAHSDTFNPKSIDDGIGSVTQKLARRIAADGFAPGK